MDFVEEGGKLLNSQSFGGGLCFGSGKFPHEKNGGMQQFREKNGLRGADYFPIDSLGIEVMAPPINAFRIARLVSGDSFWQIDALAFSVLANVG